MAPVPGDAHPAAGTHIALGRFVMLPVGDPDAATKGALWAALGVVVSVETAGAEWLLAAIETDACED